MGSDASPPSFQYKSKIVFSLILEFVPPYVFLLKPDYDSNNNNRQLLLLLLLLLLSIRILVIGSTCPPTIYFKLITTAYLITKCDSFFITKWTILLQSATCIYSSKQSFSSNQVNDQLTYSLLHYRKVQPVTLYKLT